MGKTVILCAFDTESKPFLAALTQTGVSTHAMFTVHEGVLDGVEVILACCGVCKVNAAIAVQALIDRFDISRVIMSGTAGGIDRRLRIGDTVVSTEMVYHDVQPDILTKTRPFLSEPYFRADAALITACQRAVDNIPAGHTVYFGRMVTGEAFISTEGREDIIERFNPLCVDMETAAAAHACHVNGVPFIAVRSITDTEDDVGLGSFYQNAVMASERSFLVVRALLTELRCA